MFSAIALLSVLRVTTVMPVGDSITTGGTRPKTLTRSGYREFISEAIDRNDIRVRIVGTQDLNFCKISNPMHEGYPAHSIEQMAPKVYRSAKAIKPDFVLLTAGTNNAHKGVNPLAICAALDRFLAGIHKVSPRTVVLVSDIPAIVDSPQNWDTSVRDAYNKAIPDLVAKHPYAHFVPIWGSAHEIISSDGVHPKQDAYKMAASRWMEAIENL